MPLTQKIIMLTQTDGGASKLIQKNQGVFHLVVDSKNVLPDQSQPNKPCLYGCRSSMTVVTVGVLGFTPPT